MTTASPRTSLTLTLLLLLTGSVMAGGELEESLRDLSKSLIRDLRGRDAKKLAVLDFRDIRGYRSALDPFIAEELTTQIMLVARGEFTFVERRQLDRIIAEQKLTSSAFFDENTLAGVGKILGVDTVLTGSIADLGVEVKINARAVAVQTGEVFSSASANVPKQGAVAELLRQGVGPGQDRASSGLPSITADSGSRGRQVQASDVFFENRLIRLTVSSVGLSHDKKNATLSLIVENLADMELPLAVPVSNNTGNCTMSLSDNQGNFIQIRNSELTGVPCLYMLRSEGPHSYATLSPRSRSTIVAKFTNGQPIGNIWSIGIEFITLSDNKVSRFSAGISNIEVR